MKNKRVLESSASLLAVILAYALSFGLSLWWQTAREYVAQHWGAGRFIIQQVAILIILATALMFLNWFLNHKLRPNAILSAFYLISGCILLVAPLYSYHIHIMPAFFIHNYAGALLSYATVFIGTTGVIGLIRSFRNRRQELYQGEPHKEFLGNNRVLKAALSLLAVLVMLAIAYELDLLRSAVRPLASVEFKIRLFIIVVTAIHAVLMTCFIALNWLIDYKIRPHVIVFWIIFLGGFVLLFFPLMMEFVTAITFIRDQWFRMSLLYMACAFIAVTGGSGILRKVIQAAQ